VVLELTGRHPLQDKGLRPKPPLYWRSCAPDFPTIDKVLAPEFIHWIPKNEFDRYDSRNKILYLKNGSKVDFLSYEQELEKFGAAKRHGLLLDEECPEDRYNESLMRLIDFGGRIIMCMTPIRGMSWVFDRIWLPSLQPKTEIFSVKASIWDNPYIPDEEKRKIVEQLEGDERKVREYGDWVEFAGLVWPEFKQDVHVLDPFPLPKEKTVYMAIDPMSRTQAVVWLAVLPSNRLIFFDELLVDDMVIEDVARLILEKEKSMGSIYMRLIDWNASIISPTDGRSILGEYANAGISCAPAVKDWILGKAIGKEYWNARDKDGHPKTIVFSTLKHTISHILHYVHDDPRRRMDIEPPNKPKRSKDIHLADDIRYLFAIRPEYITAESDAAPLEIPHLSPLSIKMRRGE